MIHANKPISYDEPVYIHNPILLIFFFFWPYHFSYRHLEIFLVENEHVSRQGESI